MTIPEPIFSPALMSEISQGDVFDGISNDSSIKIPSKQTCRVILLTNDCDIDKKNHTSVHVLRLIPIVELPPAAASVAKDIRENRSPAALLVPPQGNIPESFMDFRRIHRIAKTAIVDADAKGLRMQSMTDDGRVAMFLRIHTYFVRKQQAK